MARNKIKKTRLILHGIVYYYKQDGYQYEGTHDIYYGQVTTTQPTLFKFYN